MSGGVTRDRIGKGVDERPPTRANSGALAICHLLWSIGYRIKRQAEAAVGELPSVPAERYLET
jgi:hypothetical protein